MKSSLFLKWDFHGRRGADCFCKFTGLGSETKRQSASTSAAMGSDDGDDDNDDDNDGHIYAFEALMIIYGAIDF